MPERTSDERGALSVTHWFDSGSSGEPYTATVRFKGRLDRSGGRNRAGDEFVKDERLHGVVPGTGPVSVTTYVYELVPGEWMVTAELVDDVGARGRARSASHGKMHGRTLPRAEWSWRRWTLSSGAFTPVQTRWAPLVRLAPVPAVIPGTWAALVLFGSILGITLHGALLASEGVPVVPSVLLTVLAALLGLVGAKVRYIAMHPRTWRDAPGEGWAVDGFLVVMPMVVLIGLLALELPIGVFVDAGAPALFLGVAIGRLGCFFTGCCAGRCTRSRFGVWSSDRKVGARRIPTQLMESGVGLALALATLSIFLFARPPIDGLIFVVGLSAYTLARRFLLRLRAARQERTPAPRSATSARRKSLGTPR